MLPEFEACITERETMYEEALELYSVLPSSIRSKATPVHETLFPFHLIVIGAAGPWPLVPIKALVAAYHWVHSSMHINQGRHAGHIPKKVFLAGD